MSSADKHTCSECGCGLGREVNTARCDDANDAICGNCFYMETELTAEVKYPVEKDAIDKHPGGHIAVYHEKSMGLWDELS